MEKSYSIGQFAKAIGVTIQTLRNWDKADKLKPSHVSPTGYRYYSEAQRLEYIGKESGVRDQWKEGVEKGVEEADRVRQDFIQIALIMANRMTETDRKMIHEVVEQLQDKGEN